MPCGSGQAEAGWISFLLCQNSDSRWILIVTRVTYPPERGYHFAAWEVSFLSANLAISVGHTFVFSFFRLLEDWLYFDKNKTKPKTNLWVMLKLLQWNHQPSLQCPRALPSSLLTPPPRPSWHWAMPWVGLFAALCSLTNSRGKFSHF